jgi:hypothetical protein
VRPILTLGFLSILVVGTFLTSYGFCQEESKIVGKLGTVSDPDADILEVSFILTGDQLTIRYTIAGNFMRTYLYLVYFEEGEVSSKTYLAGIVVGYWVGQDNAVMSGRFANKSLTFVVSGHTMTISGITLNDIGNRYIFYSHASTGSQKLEIFDDEPRGLNQRIVLSVPLSLTLVRGASVFIDGKNYQADSSQKIQLTTPAGSHSIQVVTPVEINSGEKLVFEKWDDGSVETERPINLLGPSSYQINYKRQYLLDLRSPFGEAEGSGWYDSGTAARITLSAISTPMDSWLGFLGGGMVFDHWEGDFTSNDPSTLVTMTSPKKVEAKWREDYAGSILVFAVLLGAIGGVLIFAGRRLGTKRPTAETASAQAAEPIYEISKEAPRLQPKDPVAVEYEQLLSESNIIKQKIAKLTDSHAGGVVSIEAYKTLLADYEKRASDLRRLITEAEVRIKGELDLLQGEESRIRKELELLNAKQIVGDISEVQYMSKKSGLDARLTEIRSKRSSLTVSGLRCKFCGSPLREDSAFCMDCGRSQT